MVKCVVGWDRILQPGYIKSVKFAPGGLLILGLQRAMDSGKTSPLCFNSMVVKKFISTILYVNSKYCIY